MSSSGIANHRQVATVRTPPHALRFSGGQWRVMALIRSAPPRAKPGRYFLAHCVGAWGRLHSGFRTGVAHFLRELAVTHLPSIILNEPQELSKNVIPLILLRAPPAAFTLGRRLLLR